MLQICEKNVESHNLRTNISDSTISVLYLLLTNALVQMMDQQNLAETCGSKPSVLYMNTLVLTATCVYSVEQNNSTNLHFSQFSTYSIYQSVGRYKQLCTIFSDIFQIHQRTSAAPLTSIISLVLSTAETYSINLPASLRPFCLYFPCCF